MGQFFCKRMQNIEEYEDISEEEEKPIDLFTIKQLK